MDRWELPHPKRVSDKELDALEEINDVERRNSF